MQEVVQTVHEHVGNHLEGLEQGRVDVMRTQQSRVVVSLLRQNKHNNKNSDV